jgi:23S rRNA (cytidine1920-2'-O)/16S rRNA (cytidine1409-2'-O)-methyltransferase
MRLDEAMVSRKLSTSRSRAVDAITRGCVTVNGAPARKHAQKVTAADVIVLDDPARKYVSRAALKLIAALDHYGISPAGLFCLDIGASTGGFTEVLLERGARQVLAIDVGHDQLHYKLKGHPRLTSVEGVNARDIDLELLGEPPQLIVVDVSFISLSIALPAALGLAKQDANLVALIKPQFEVGREGLGKGGIVRDEALLQVACDKVLAFLEAEGWDAQPLLASPIDGSDGNREFLVAAKKR